jgi:hypothetical protein
MISFVTLLKLDKSDIPLVSLPVLFHQTAAFSFVSAYSVLQESPSEVTGNNTGLAWSGILGSLLSLLYHLCFQALFNLISAHIILAGPLVLFLPCPFTGIITI